jgi:hypothetical protein
MHANPDFPLAGRSRSAHNDSHHHRGCRQCRITNSPGRSGRSSRSATTTCTVQDVEFAVLHGRDRGFSRQSGLPLYEGRSRDGRRVIVVYNPLDATQIAVVTAFVVKTADEDV